MVAMEGGALLLLPRYIFVLILPRIDRVTNVLESIQLRSKGSKGNGVLAVLVLVSNNPN